jgi:hypothetical protein
MLAISDIRHRHLLFRYRNKICRTTSFYSDIGRVPISTLVSIPYRIFRYLSLIDHFKQNRVKFYVMLVLCLVSNPQPSYLVSYHCATRIIKLECRISDIGQNFIPISDIMSDSALYGPISDVSISGSVR